MGYKDAPKSDKNAGIFENQTMDENTTIEQIFLHARTILCDESKWAREWDAQDKRGDSVTVCSRQAVKWSVLGAISRARDTLDGDYYRHTAFEKVYRKFQSTVLRNYPDRATIPTQALTYFNRHKLTTFSEVEALFAEVGASLGQSSRIVFTHMTEPV